MTAAKTKPVAVAEDATTGTVVTTYDHFIVDNTDAVEAVEPEPESSEQDLGNGITLVSYV